MADTCSSYLKPGCSCYSACISLTIACLLSRSCPMWAFSPPALNTAMAPIVSSTTSPCSLIVQRKQLLASVNSRRMVSENNKQDAASDDKSSRKQDIDGDLRAVTRTQDISGTSSKQVSFLASFHCSRCPWHCKRARQGKCASG